MSVTGLTKCVLNKLIIVTKLLNKFVIITGTQSLSKTEVLSGYSILDNHRGKCLLL